MALAQTHSVGARPPISTPKPGSPAILKYVVLLPHCRRDSFGDKVEPDKVYGVIKSETIGRAEHYCFDSQIGRFPACRFRLATQKEIDKSKGESIPSKN